MTLEPHPDAYTAEATAKRAHRRLNCLGITAKEAAYNWRRFAVLLRVEQKRMIRLSTRLRKTQ